MARRPFVFLSGLLTLGSLAFACDGEPDDIADDDRRRSLGGDRGSDGGSGGRGDDTGGTGGDTGGTGGIDGLAGFGGVPVNCPDAQTLCSDECVTVASDRAHCGACDSPCGESELCVSGECELVCPPGMLACSNSCIHAPSDPSFCGATYCDETGTDGAPCELDEACDAGECRVFTREWTTGARVDTLDGAVGQEHAIAIDDTGDAVVVWRQKAQPADDTFHVFAAFYDASTKSWDGIEQLDDGNTLPVRNLDVAISPAGIALAVWVEGTTGSPVLDERRVMAAAFDKASGAWSSAERVNEPQAGAETLTNTPDVAMDAQGDGIVVWTQTPAGAAGAFVERVFRSSYVDGVFQDPVAFPPQNDGRTRFPRVAVNAAGQAAVVWEERASDSSSLNIPVYSEGTITGTWIAPADVRQDTNYYTSASSAGAVHVGIDEEGDAFLVFTAASLLDSPNYQLALTTRLEQSGVLGNELIRKDADVTLDFHSARIVVSRDGNAAIVLQRAATVTPTSTPTDWHVVATRYDAATLAWSPLTTISGVYTAPFDSKPQPRVGMDALGNVIAAWVFGNDAQAVRYSAEYSGWSSPTAINTAPLGNGTNVALGVSAPGTATVAWVQEEDSTSHLFVARYD